MSTTYRLVMSDGSTYQKVAASAGEAIYAALNKHPGRTVAKCHSGLTEAECADLRKQGKSGVLPGVIDYEIPVHQAIPEAVYDDSEE